MKGGSFSVTISETFANHNTAVTLYTAGPFSLIFTLRFYRTLTNEFLYGYQKKIILVLLLSVQYTTMVVIRNDTIRGNTHYIFVLLTFVFIFVYHCTVREIFCDVYKQFVMFCSGLSMLFFTFSLTQGSQDDPNYTARWTLACIFEVLAVFLLSILDLIDVFVLGARLDLENECS
jgi:hypothetical protein